MQLDSTAILVRGISKSYGDVQALNDISFEVRKGELFGLIGPDGAGKTSLIRILISLLLPDSGMAQIGGLDIVKESREIRRTVGYMPGHFSLYQDLSVEENLEFFATIFGSSIEENYDLIKDIYQQIEPFKKRKAGKLSGGMKQKLALSCALIHRPKVLFLDEPTTGVDAVSRQEFWEMLQKMKASGISILVSTPYMDEASLCDRVALIQNGEIMRLDTPGNIIATFDKPLFAIQSEHTYQLIKDLRAYEGTHSAYPFGDSVHLTTKKEKDLEPLSKYLKNKGHHQLSVEAINAEIEDCFMELMANKG